MKQVIKLISLVFAAGMLLSACAPATTPTTGPQATASTKVPSLPTATTTHTYAPTSSAAIANPAAKYCADQGLKSEIRTAADGSQYGVCKFPDGTECEEWAYFRGECKAGQYSLAPTPVVTPAKSNTDY